MGPFQQNIPYYFTLTAPEQATYGRKLGNVLPVALLAAGDNQLCQPLIKICLQQPMILRDDVGSCLGIWCLQELEDDSTDFLSA